MSKAGDEKKFALISKSEIQEETVTFQGKTHAFKNQDTLLESEWYMKLELHHVPFPYFCHSQLLKVFMNALENSVKVYFKQSGTKYLPSNKLVKSNIPRSSSEL